MDPAAGVYNGHGQLMEKDIYSVGDVVAYEYLEGEQFWQWAVAKIIDKPTPRICQLQLWHPQERLLSDAEEQRKKKMADAIHAKSENAELERTSTEALEKQLEQDAIQIATTRRLAAMNIARLQPIVEAAKRGLNSIREEHLREMRSYPTPPPMVKTVLEAVMICFNKSPDTWTTIREFIRKDDFIATVRDFEPSTMTETSRLKLENSYSKDPKFTFENAQRASRAAGPLLKWVLAQLEYAKIMKQVRPLQMEIEQLGKAKHATELKLEEAKLKAAGIDAELGDMQEEYDKLVFGGANASSPKKGGNREGSPHQKRAEPVNFLEWVPGEEPFELKFILHSTILRSVATIDDNRTALQQSDVNFLKTCPHKAGRDLALETKAKRLENDLDAAEEELMDKTLELNVEQEDNKRQRELVKDLQAELDKLRAQLQREQELAAREKMGVELDLVEAQENFKEFEDQVQEQHKKAQKDLQDERAVFETMRAASAAEHEAELQAMQQERDDQSKKASGLQHDVSELQQRLNDSEDTKNKQVADLQALLAQAKEDAAREMKSALDEERCKSEAALQAKDEELEEEREKTAAAESALEAKNEVLESLSQELEEEREKTAAAESALEAKNEVLESLSQELEEVRTKFKEKAKTDDEFTKDLEQAKSDLEEERQRTADAESAANTIADELREVQHQLYEERQRWQTTQELLTTKEQALVELTQHSDNMKMSLQSHEKELESQRERTRIAEAALATKNGDTEQAESVEVEQLRHELENQRTRAAESEAELEAQNKELKLQLDELQRRHTTMEQSLEEQLCQAQELAAEAFEAKKNELQDEMDGHATTKGDLAAAKEELKMLKIELEKERQRAVDAEAGLEAKHEELAQTQQQSTTSESSARDSLAHLEEQLAAEKERASSTQRELEAANENLANANRLLEDERGQAEANEEQKKEQMTAEQARAATDLAAKQEEIELAARELALTEKSLAEKSAELEEERNRSTAAETALQDMVRQFEDQPQTAVDVDHKAVQTGDIEERGTSRHADPAEREQPEADDGEEQEEVEEEEEEYEEEEDEDWIPIHEIDEQARFLIAAFEITKLTKSKLSMGEKRVKRVWVIDQLQQKFHKLNENGTKLSRSYQHTQLIMLEKSFEDPLRLTLLFYGVDHNHDMIFSSPYTRERFYELAQAMRSTVVCYAPMLVKEDFVDSAYVKANIDASDGIVVSDKMGNVKNVKGKCSINASVVPTEDMRIWVGSHNWAETQPGRGFDELRAWVPRTGEFDLYAIAITNAPLPPPNPTQLLSTNPNILSDEKRYEEFFNKWYAMLKAYLGTGYQPVAPIAHKGMTLIVFARSKLLSKISAVEGAKVCTSGLDESLGACGIVFRVFDTDFCFVSCKLQQHLHASELTVLVDAKNADTGVDEPSIMPTAQELEEELNRKRQQQMAMICKNLQFSICDGEFSNQFDHVFLCGDFGYTLDPQAGGALQAAAKQADATTRRNPGGYNEVLRSYDGLCRARAKDGFMSAFQLPPTAFPPTSPSTAASSGGDGVGPTLPAPPSYLTRILYRSVEEPLRRFRCMAYDACDQLAAEQRSSPFTPVKAHFAVRMARPSLACLHRTQAPVPVITLEKISFSIIPTESTSNASSSFTSTHSSVSKPVLQLYAPFSSCHGGRFACTESNTAHPTWLASTESNGRSSSSSPTAKKSGNLFSRLAVTNSSASAVLPTALPKLECLTQIIPTIESKHCYLVLQDDNVPKTKPTHILGTASLSLRGRLTENLRGVSQAFTSDLVANGSVVGTLSGSLHWDASVEGPELLTRGINLASAELR